MLGQRLGHTGIVGQKLHSSKRYVHSRKDVDLRVNMQPLPAASVIPPLLIVKVVAGSPPPILFWPSDS
jgi:hypothetical protein